MGNSLMSGPEGSSASSGVKIPILFGVVFALMGASGYLFYELKEVREEIATTRDSLLAEIAKVHETSNVSMQTNQRSVDSLKSELDEARRVASQLAGQAKLDASKHADELASKLQKMQEEQTAKVNEKVSAVSADLSTVKEDSNQNKNRISEVSTDVAGVKTDAAATKAQLEKTIAELKTAQGDMGIQSGLIATNSKQLAALKELGERNYIEFTITKEKAPRKVGDIQVRLKKTDAKKNRYTIEVIADDKTVEKKDKTINEPVQFLLSRAMQPYELVVNNVAKDKITGYLAEPKIQQARN
jgi:hypothetical protein